MRYALVHEWLTPLAKGGSELVVEEILRHVDADVYALIDFESTNPQSYLYKRGIGTTFLQHFPLASHGVQKYLPLLPIAIEQLDLSPYDVILSSSHAVAKGVLAGPNQLHICYCHTPMRYAWDLTFDYLAQSPLGKAPWGWVTRYLLHRLRQWDVVSANRVDYFIANSQHTARRIWRCYRREATVIYPPVNLDRFKFEPKKGDFFLTVSRLVGYKKVGLIVQAFNQLGLPLVVIGEGPELKEISAIAQANVHILGSQPNEVVAAYLAQARAFVYMACEDFGIALVEAQACGTPVIAYGAGGATETVIDMSKNPKQASGLLFSHQTTESLITAVKTFVERENQFNPENCVEQAQKFSAEIFKKCYTEFLERCTQQWRLQQLGEETDHN
ncbi:glycosyltransferase [Gloeocapsa sp. PCC 73106]|uniref:glycosyltransferase n=1 Tax=Gloeocapsa sp. PCC 73106 TaxID=102232 RepID=UPI0002AC916B|nr:glycosyltransferase [Gloeocapsa sp. PCC 73106]ELR99367.1 glycosyltransferase [Gloeocapsa sp. PCC 73106]